MSTRLPPEQESEKRFSVIFNSSPVGMAITRFSDGLYLDVNKQFLNLMGYKRAEVVGQTSTALHAWVNPEERAVFVKQLTEHQRVLEHTAYFRKKSGMVWIARLSAEVIQIDGEAMILSLLQDITERQRGEVAMGRLAAIVETADEAIIGESVEGIVTSWNQGAERLYGYKAEEIVGRSAAILFPVGRETEFTLVLELIGRGERVQPFDTVRARKDGSQVEVSTAVSPILDATGKVVASATIERDVSNRRRVEEAILQLNSDLEKRVEERTKAAEQANIAKSSFLATMSHEIRTPMNAVIGFTNLALRTSLTTQQKDYLSKIYSAGVSLLALINDILDFSKIEAGRLDIEDIDFFLQAVVDQVSSLNGHGAFAKGLEFLIDVSPAIPPSLTGDPNRLNQILTNLIANSIKFTSQGEIRLNVDLLETTGDKVKLRFSVRDTGVGMTDEQISKLFQPFSQADASITRKFGGTGLGLSIVRRLVELMGGQIWAQSILGSGSTFAFTSWFGVSQRLSERPSLPRRLDGTRVLVVDDNTSANTLMAEILKSMRFRVESADSGAKAVEAVHTADPIDPFGLVLMDCEMSGVDGLEATRRILLPRSLQNPPVVILLSALLGSDEGRKQAMGTGAAEFLQKPVTPSTLLDAVVRVFGGTTPVTQGEVESAHHKLHHARVLLVEDNEMNQQIAAELLRSEGAEVVIAASGHEAIEQLTSAPRYFDVVLMDIQMPGMDGYETTRHIRAQEWGRTIPILAMTAHALDEERQRAFESGMDDHITKPIDPEAMFQVIAKHYRAGSVSGQAVSALRTDLQAADGIALSEGVRRAGGNEKLYFELLQSFVGKHRTSAQDIRQALKRGDTQAAEKLSHSLNGVAGNLGLVNVHANAAELEQRIRKGEPPESLEAAVVRLAQSYEAAAEALQFIMPAGAPKTAASPSSQSEAEILRKLEGLLGDSDGQAGEYFEDSFEVLSTVFALADLENIRKNLRNYDYGEALALLRSLGGGKST